MSSISQILKIAKQELATVTETPDLESEVLLAHELKVSRSYLHTCPEKLIDDSQQKIFFDLIARRKNLEPIAYITGHREFWSLDLLVSPDVLIPRPETELLVELILEKIKVEHAVIADLGTGSGAIALALAHEKPNWIIHATDKSRVALKIAQINAERLSLKNIIFHQGDWCEALPNKKFHAIISNPPYVAKSDMNTGLTFEPYSALISEDNGLKDLSQIIAQAKNYLTAGGILVLEHGFQQAKNVACLFGKAGYTTIGTHQDLAGLDRVTTAVAASKAAN